MKDVVSIALVVLVAVSASAQGRSWKDRTGKFSIQAELVESDGTAVTLKRADGKVIKVSLERLSTEDRQYVESLEKSAFGDTQPVPATATAANVPALRYGWKAGKQYAYKVKIEVDLGDEVLEMAGNPNYRVSSADKDRAELAFRGVLIENTRPKGGGLPFGPRGFGRMGMHGPRMHFPFSPMTGLGLHGLAREIELTVDPLGGVVREEGTSQLPFLLGNLSLLMIEQLPATPQQTWTVEHGSGIVIKEGGFPRFGPFASDEGFVPATEKTTYSVEKTTDKAVEIRKQYEFRAAVTGRDRPPFEITGEGKYIFNREEGVSGELDFSMKVTVRKGGLGVELPIKATYHLIGEAEAAAMAKSVKEAAAEAKRPLGDQETTDIVADLKSGRPDREMKAIQKLMLKTPDKPDEGIAKALEELVLNEQKIFRGLAASVLEKWSTPANVPGLIKMLEDKAVRASAMKALTKHKTPRAIEPVAKLLGESFASGPAVEFLKAMGPAAEPAVVPQLASLLPATRKAAAQILKDIGTEKSIPALDKATTDPDDWVARAAQEALAAVKKRQQSAP